MGIRPLFYTTHNGTFYFGSEVKSLFSADSQIPRSINYTVLKEIFSCWVPCGNETIFDKDNLIDDENVYLINAIAKN